MKSVSELSLGESARVTDIRVHDSVSQRLMTLGLLPGMTIRLVQLAPLGDPIAVEFNGQRISLRRQEAAGILVDSPQSAPVA